VVIIFTSLTFRDETVMSERSIRARVKSVTTKHSSLMLPIDLTQG
jgi:hypothetical protein